MKLVKTTFTNESFFSRYAPLVKILAIVSLIGQLISGSTESIIIYSASLMNLEKMLNPAQAHILAIVITILGVAIIELGLFVLLPISIQAFLYKRFKGLDLLVSVFVVPACVFLMCIGTIMSFKASKQIAQKGFGNAEQISTSDTELKYEKQIENEESKLTLSLSHLNNEKNTLIKQLQENSDTKLNELAQMIKQFESKESRTGKSYISSKERLQKRITEERSKHQSEKLKTIQKYDSLVQDEREDAKQRISKIESKRDSELSNIIATNKNSKAKHESNISMYGALLGYLNVVMVFILLVSNIIREAHHKGSGIESKVIVSDSYFQENVLVSFLKALVLLIDTKLREFVNWIESKTPDTPQPIQPQTLINRRELNQISVNAEPRNRIGFNRHEKTTKNHELNSQKTCEVNKQGDYEYRNTLRDLTKYKKRLASHKQKALHQKKTKGFVLDRTDKAILNNSLKIKELTQKLNLLSQN